MDEPKLGHLEMRVMKEVWRNGRATVHDVIYGELCHGRILDESRAAYRRIVAELVRQGAEGVILGCTEIGMLLRPQDADVPLFDTAAIHAEEAARFALVP